MEQKNNMKNKKEVTKSLFRKVDIVELECAYIAVFFTETFICYMKNLHLNLAKREIAEQIISHKVLIELLLSLLVVVFYYQFLVRKKTEIFCRILVGDTMREMTVRYLKDCMKILGSTFLVCVLVKFVFMLDLRGSYYLLCLFILFILISSSQVHRYEKF